MVARVVFDVVKRSWWRVLGQMPLAWLAWSSASDGQWRVQTALALLIAIVVTLGSAMTSQLSSREMRLLPISRRAMRKIHWAVSILIPVAWVAMLTLAAVFKARLFSQSPRRIDLETAGVSIVVLLASSGLLWALERWRLARIASDGPGGIAALASLLVGFAFLGGFALREYLPTRWDDLFGPAGVIVGVGVALAMGLLFAAPPAHPPLVRSNVVTGTTRSATAVLANHWTDLAYLFRSEARSTMFGLIGVVIIIAFVYLVEFAMPAHGRRILDSRAWTLPFGHLADYGAAFRGLFLTGCIAINLRWLDGENIVASLARQLRILPLTTRQIVFVTLAQRAAAWVIVWFALLCAFILTAGGWPASLHLELLAAAVGFDALAYAVLLQTRRGGVWTTVFAVAIALSGAWSNRAPAHPFEVVTATGVACLVAAAAVNLRAVRRSETYTSNVTMSSFGIRPIPQ